MRVWCVILAVMQGSTALLVSLVSAADAAADGWRARGEWVESVLRERAARTPAAAATAANAPPQLVLHLAFGGAAYCPLTFVNSRERDLGAAAANGSQQVGRD